MTSGIVPEASVWIDSLRHELAKDVLRLMHGGVRCIGVGGTSPPQVHALAKHLNCSAHNDLRKLLIDQPSTYLLLASSQGVGSQDIQTAIAQDCMILAIDPVTRMANDVSLTSEQRANIITIGSFTASPGWLHAADPAEALGVPRSMSFTAFGPRSQRSLLAHLYEAWQLVLKTGPMPETIDASLVTATPTTTAWDDELANITGHMVAHARIAGGRTASLHLSDQAPMTMRQFQVIGDEAMLRVTDHAHELIHISGKLIDRSEPATNDDGFAGLIAGHWNRLLQHSSEPGARVPDEHAKVLACCMASVLSARTGQGESPARLQEMHKAGVEV